MSGNCMPVGASLATPLTVSGSNRVAAISTEGVASDAPTTDAHDSRRGSRASTLLQVCPSFPLRDRVPDLTTAPIFR